MPRFFVDREQISDNYISITGEDVKHIKKVLRLREGEKIEVCDGCGEDFECKIESLSDDVVRAEIIKRYPNTAEAPIEIRVYQGMPKNDKMDYIVRKCVELGVCRIVPVITKRAVSIPRDAEKKTARWQRIADEAAKQCGRGVLPRVENTISFSDAIKAMSDENAVSIMPYECEKEGSLSALLKSTDKKKINVFIGPEGGFDESEAEKARAAGIATVTLGPRILRTETAPLAVCSAIMYELGDW